MKWRFNEPAVMPCLMDIDLERLRNYVKQLKADRQDSPIGKTKSGATQVIRNNLEELERMYREDGVTWTEIAAGLAAQGVTQGDSQPITGRRLTALMHNIKVQEEKSQSRERRAEGAASDSAASKPEE
jgi:hypothetical protein